MAAASIIIGSFNSRPFLEVSCDTYYEPYQDADLVPGWSMCESGARHDSHLAR